MKDIFLDTNLAKNLINPLSDSFKEFIIWLNKDGALVFSNHLKREYGRGNQNLATIVNNLAAKGRINNIPNQVISNFKFSKSVEKKFLSNYKDRVHIKTVVLSERKLALALDINLQTDISGLPKINGIKPNCKDCPNKIKYK